MYALHSTDLIWFVWFGLVCIVSIQCFAFDWISCHCYSFPNFIYCTHKQTIVDLATTYSYDMQYEFPDYEN